jgi:hypothetical protein
MALHLGRRSARKAPLAMSEFQVFMGSRRGTLGPIADVVAQNADGWIRARIARGEAGTRPDVWWLVMQPGEGPRLLRVLLHPHAGVREVHETEAAALHRLGQLWPEEEELYRAGVLPLEKSQLAADHMNTPGIRCIEAAIWRAMTREEQLAVLAEVRQGRPAAATQ